MNFWEEKMPEPVEFADNRPGRFGECYTWTEKTCGWYFYNISNTDGYKTFDLYYVVPAWDKGEWKLTGNKCIAVLIAQGEWEGVGRVQKIKMLPKELQHYAPVYKNYGNGQLIKDAGNVELLDVNNFGESSWYRSRTATLLNIKIPQFKIECEDFKPPPYW
jgi:hypothetical protein